MASEYVSKVVLGSSTLIDLTADTVDAAHLASGYTAHGADGAQVSGTLSFVTYHVSSSNPTSSDGSDGDVWLVTG